jgi:hypothetical protein
MRVKIETDIFTRKKKIDASGNDLSQKNVESKIAAISNIPPNTHKRRSMALKRRQYVLEVYYPTCEERNGVIQAAKDAGIPSVSAYLRTLTRGPNTIPPRDPSLTQALFAVNRELTIQGKNLCQLTAKMNADPIASVQSLSLLEILARSILQTHQTVRKVLAQGKVEP